MRVTVNTTDNVNTTKQDISKPADQKDAVMLNNDADLGPAADGFQKKINPPDNEYFNTNVSPADIQMTKITLKEFAQGINDNFSDGFKNQNEVAADDFEIFNYYNFETL